MRTEQLDRRILYGALGLICLGILLLLIAISTDYWVTLMLIEPQYRNATGGYVYRMHSGLWKICRRERYNNTLPVYERDYCMPVKLFPTLGAVNLDPEVDATILNYSRAETAFAIISLAFVALGCFFSYYAVREPRYMFKRLAGIVHIMTAGCILVTAEVVIQSVTYERNNLPARHPFSANISYGFSFVLAWISFGVFIIAALTFLLLSRKRKGSKARSEKEAMENEPVNIGRI